VKTKDIPKTRDKTLVTAAGQEFQLRDQTLVTEKFVVVKTKEIRKTRGQTLVTAA
jgi:hypothetical protein